MPQRKEPLSKLVLTDETMLCKMRKRDKCEFIVIAIFILEGRGDTNF